MKDRSCWQQTPVEEKTKRDGKIRNGMLILTHIEIYGDVRHNLGGHGPQILVVGTCRLPLFGCHIETYCERLSTKWTNFERLQDLEQTELW